MSRTPYIWAERLVRQSAHEVPEAAAVFVIEQPYADTESFLTYVAQHGFRRDFKWLIKQGVITETVLDLFRLTRGI